MKRSNDITFELFFLSIIIILGFILHFIFSFYSKPNLVENVLDKETIKPTLIE